MPTGTANTWYEIDYWCFTVNSYGNTWTAITLPAYPQVRGWIYSGNLADGGSNVACDPMRG